MTLFFVVFCVKLFRFPVHSRFCGDMLSFRFVTGDLLSYERPSLASPKMAYCNLTLVRYKNGQTSFWFYGLYLTFIKWNFLCPFLKCDTNVVYLRYKIYHYGCNNRKKTDVFPP